ncbi:hypothetical protein R5R35_011387 [Gryllus longicercus]|uniref:ATP-dependent helicase ATRX n=1 Tax=Gryllus longicercus TaxID=2509291 RepID=A0AAN9ZHC6_9ORTH
MDSSPAITLPSDEELQTAVESENTYKDFKKQPKPKMRVIDTVKEELKYRAKKTDVLEKESLSCTTCGKDLKIHLSSSNSSTILSHPVLGVLLCKSCAEFYGEGEFSVDEDGTDKYCRWCGQGGTLYLCSECNFGFCRACIKRNLQRSVLKDVQEDDWKCFACKPYPLWDLRASCAAALKCIDENRKSKRRGSHSSKSRKSKISSSGSESEQVQKKADIQKKKKRGSSSDTSELRKRKRSYSSPEESLGKKKKKRENSEETLGERNELNKHLYVKEIDRNTTLDVKAAETVATSCKEQIEYFLKFLRAMTSEVKKVLKEEIIVENLVEYTGRKKLLKKVMLLEEMSCQSVSQVCENFILGYRKSFVSVTENNEQKDKNSDSEKESPAQKEGCKPNENMEEQQNDEIIEKPKTKYAKPSVHQFSESDNSGEELCQSDVNKMEKNKSDSENSKEKLKNNSNDERVLDKNGNDNNDDESSSECSKSKSDTNDSKKHKNDELNEKHDNSEEEIESNDQKLQSNSDISSQVLQSEDACGDKPKLCVERSENGHLTDSKIVDKGDQVSLKNKQKKIRNSDKSSNDLCEEKEIRNGENESEENNLVCDDNEKSNMKSNKEMQVSDKLETQQTISKRKSVLESAEENSGSDHGSLRLTKHVEEKSKNSSGASTEPISCEENIDKKDETHLKDLNLLDKNNLGFPDGEEKEKGIDVGSDEDVISDSGSEKQHKMNKSVANSEKLDSFKNSTEKNFLRDSAEEKDDLIAGETSNEKNSLSSCKDNLKDSKDGSADSEGENHDKKSTLSSHKDASSESDRDNVGNTDEEILSIVATKSSHKDASSDSDRDNAGNLDSGGQGLSGEESDRTDLKNETNSGSEADDHVDRNEKKSSLKETNKKKKNMKPKCNEDEEKKAMMALLASSSSDESHISFRKHRKPTASDMPKEKCGPLSSKSLAYQNSHRKNQSGVFSDASEGMKGESDKKHSSEGGESDESTEKLQKCSVVVKRLPDEIYEKYRNNCSSRDSQQKDSEKEEIKKLVNLKTLDNKLNKKIPTVDSDSEGDEDENVKKKKVFRKHAKKNDNKKEKETLKDFHDKDELSSQSEHLDFSDNDGNEKRGLKGFLEELQKSRDKFAEELLLRSSDSDLDLISSNKTEKEKKKKESKVKMKEEPKVKEENEDDKENSTSKKKGSEDSDESDDEIKKRKKWRNDKLLRMKLSETDTSEEERKWEARKAKDAKEKEKGSDSEDPPAIKKKSKKTGAQRRLLNSDSDVLTISSDSPSSDSDDNLFKPSAKRKHKGSSGSDKSKKKSSASESDQSAKKKTKRRRIKKPASDSSNSDSNDDVQSSQKTDTTPNKGRKNIRKVMKDDNVAEATRRAAKEEEERRKRIAEKQKLYNALYNLAEAQVETVDKLVLDFDAETKKELVQVDKNLVKKLKPHQVKGVKFMWDACFESLEMIKKSEGSGCILAHCMGLGKTLQVITLAHTLLNNHKTKIKTVLVVCPLSTVLNWVSEFSKWLDETEDNDIEVMDITRYKQMYERIGLLKHWHSKGGVLILSYSSYRTLTNPSIRRQKKKSIESLQATLVDPGPDLVICDEGHQLKNEESALSKAMSRLRTKRRIVLTGTPLQNNLLEYHCMVQFVKPNLLGTKKEFKNRFINPINNGQYDNSTAHDVKVMKRRAHVLHKMLDSSVQRYDYSVLTPFLPPKFEYVLLVRLTDLQIKLYKYFLENLSFASPDGQKTKTARLFSDFQALQRIWTHPRVLLMNAERREKKQLLEEDYDSEGSLKDFIATSSESSSSSDSDVEEVIKKSDNKRRTRSAKKDDNGSESGKSEKNDDETEDKYGHRGEWWWQFISDDSQLDDIQQSGKIAMLFTILEECEKIGDKVLVFSQSLLSLDLIEFFLRKKDEESQNNDVKEKTSWCLGSDYFRLDGSSNAENRMAWCNCFNKEDNYRARLFLISTRAGGLGINLTAANRVIIFDASWNPSYDVQSIFRVYRFGQKKPCYIYRFLAQHTMEEKIYNRQVTKLSLACRVVDEQQIERHYSMDDLQELYNFNPEEKKAKETPLVPKDVLLAELVRGENSWVDSYHEHDTLLENKEEEELNEEERKAAWEDYEKEKQGPRPSVAMYDNSSLITYLNQFGYTEHQIRDSIMKENPQWSDTQIQFHVGRVLKQIHDYVAAQEYRKQVQAQFNLNRGQQPMYFHNPSTQDIMGQNQYQNAMQNMGGGHLLQQLTSQQPSNAMQTMQPQPGSSQAVDNSNRIKVKSFGHMTNSNFGNTSQMNQLVPNPFASKTGIAAGAINKPTMQKSSNNGVADVIEVE